ncbi:uncharacterized protein KQ657_002327 [Scheffersomyces spartinae]|uniref:Mannosyl-oligosaccharide glucosidase n=1 Tax=Scheffersomyces spartinae TaxID=45513 RepID=A0A9P7VEU3_9ASCO|nr:uncharacterized protein KQ657_002327 [Scheffersomyces spartinae]KAG7195941.1 hypothetical protein KQ657_002327 [Scheffersomyces spartinae]
MVMSYTAEELRLRQDKERTHYWKKFGPYLLEREWATVREDYSSNGDAWLDFPFEHSRSRTYRWGEDGLAGVSDTHQLICLSMALWNGNDSILKEKLYGLTNSQGNHGEDVKELYYYLDNTPTHSYMKYLYKYPHSAFPYKELIDENAKRGRLDREFEITDTEAFKDNNYFDVVFEMAKADEDPEELYFRITAYNRGDKAAPLHIMPHLVLRNTWGWGTDSRQKPSLSATDEYSIEVDHAKFGKYHWVFAPSPGSTDEDPDVEPQLLFTENETNFKRLYNQENISPYVKDAFHDFIIENDEKAINPENKGTKACAWYKFDSVPAGDYVTLRYKLSKSPDYLDEFELDQVFAKRQDEADSFYWKINPLPMKDTLRQVQRQAFAGLLWTKQFYHFIHDYWSKGDPNAKLRPMQNRADGRNKDWKHLYIEDILSMPDKWEYPFFAAWDTAFQCIPFAMVDPVFAKKQISLLTREWYMHPNGQIPAYEWNFSDVNPPVHAWSAYRIFKIERKMYGVEDLEFLETVFHKLLLNFTWWVNRKDFHGDNLFGGGFLGLDNIGVFNRSEDLPTGGTLKQADSTGWMAFFSLQMLNIALELAKTKPVYENIASKFFEHFIMISDALSFKNELKTFSLWNDEDKFFYDAIDYGTHTDSLPVRSLVGLIPLYASLTLEPDLLDRFPSFKKRLEWFVNNNKDVAERNIASMEARGMGERLLLSLVSKDKLVSILQRMLDEDEFLSDYGIRSLSKYHKDHPFSLDVSGQHYKVEYLPGESDSGMFGGNSNWRGPIWFPTNFLLVEALQRFYLYYGPELKVECPKGSGQMLNLAQVAQEIQHRLMHLFVPDENGRRACIGDSDLFNSDPYFADYVPFYEYFDGDTGRGLGASHQCGWTAVVAKWIHDNGTSCRIPKTPHTPAEPQIPSNVSEYDVTKFVPKTGPFPGRLIRRRLGKSLVNLTIHSLDLGDDESEARLNQNALRRMGSRGENVTADMESLAPQLSRGSIDSQEGPKYDNEFFSQIRDAFKKYKSRESEDRHEEFEAEA